MGSAPNVPASIYQRRLHLPSADEIDDAELAQAIAEVQRLRDKAEKAKDDAGAAHFELEAAEQRDHQALADHARKGGRKPSPTAEAVRAKKAKLEAGASVLATAAQDAEAELLELFQARGPELAARQRERAEAEVVKAHEAAAAAAQHLAKRRELLSIASFLDSPEKGRRFPRDLEPSTMLRKANHDPVSVDEALSLVVESTRADREPKRTRDQRTWQGQRREPQPLKPVPRAA